jgi:SpoVK/Ycf46/Vps4 family AAA+-type ATPase
MTASMLPKLQDLHDRGRIVLFVCTNFLSSIDPAMRRVGRIDHLIGVPPPDDEQRLSIIRRELKLERVPSNQRNLLTEAAEEMARNSGDFIRGELVAAARQLKERGPFVEIKDATKVARDIVKDLRPGTAMEIQKNKKGDDGKNELERFQADLKGLSEPHRTRTQGRA